MGPTKMSISRLCYRSALTFTEMTLSLEEELERIVATARANNARTGLRGALIMNGTTFFQVLEGPADALEATFSRIEADRRHHDLTVIDRRTDVVTLLPNAPLFFCDTLDAHDGVLASLAMPIMQAPELVSHDDLISVSVFASARLSRSHEVSRRLSA
ncbi:BLUF domain-containing protein [Stappia sp.]|nr:BLUF domain-containing protein [Stappia sp.]